MSLQPTYDKLRKVYSIWVCTNPSTEYKDTVTQYSMSKKSLEGEIKFSVPEDAEKERRDYASLLDLMTRRARICQKRV